MSRQPEESNRPGPAARLGTLAGSAGFSLVEVTVSMGITVAVLGATMAALTGAIRTNETAVFVTGMNHGLRTSMDLVVKDLLQVGSGLPTGHVVLIPSGTGALQVRRPGPPVGPNGANTAYLTDAGDPDMSAVLPGPGLGPVVNGVATDIVTTLAADSTFHDVALAARAADGSSITVAPSVNIATGQDRVLPGQLIMLEKGSTAVLLQVTSVDAASRRINFAVNDSMRLNQPSAASGGAAALNAAAPAPDTVPIAPATTLSTTATRIRMISYYLDARDPAHARLVRRVNNGHQTTFDNTLGTAVAFDLVNLQFTYDLADGLTNPSSVRFTAADLAGTGACAPNPCNVNQIRKINVMLTGRSRGKSAPTGRFLYNTLTSQVSLRGMSFVNEYTGS
jgi:hypothetical protein